MTQRKNYKTWNRYKIMYTNDNILLQKIQYLKHYVKYKMFFFNEIKSK